MSQNGIDGIGELKGPEAVNDAILLVHRPDHPTQPHRPATPVDAPAAILMFIGAIALMAILLNIPNRWRDR